MTTVDFALVGAIFTRAHFNRLLLIELDAPATPRNMAALTTWAVAEGCRARYNPLSTTEPWPGATKFNSAGVKHYRSLIDGVLATKKTLLNGKYDPIVGALRDGASLQATIRAIGSSPWGTKASDLHWQPVWADLAPYSRIPIGQ